MLLNAEKSATGSAYINASTIVCFLLCCFSVIMLCMHKCCRVSVSVNLMCFHCAVNTPSHNPEHVSLNYQQASCVELGYLLRIEVIITVLNLVGRDCVVMF